MTLRFSATPFNPSLADNVFRITGSSDATKQAAFEVDGFTTATTRTFTLPNADVVVAGSAAALTSGRVPFVTAGGLLTDSAAVTWNGTSFAVTTTASNGAIVARTDPYSSGGGASIAIRADDGTTAIGSGHRLGSISLQGRRDVSTVGTPAVIAAFATEAWSTSAMGSKLTFETTPNTTTARAVVLTLDQDQSATFAGTVSAPASTTARTSVRIPHGSAPTSPVDGDMWTTTAGLFVRINGSTVGPLS